MLESYSELSDSPGEDADSISPSALSAMVFNIYHYTRGKQGKSFIGKLPMDYLAPFLKALEGRERVNQGMLRMLMQRLGIE